MTDKNLRCVSLFGPCHSISFLARRFRSSGEAASWAPSINASDEPMILRRKYKVGQIVDYDGDTYLVITDGQAQAIADCGVCDVGEDEQDVELLESILTMTNGDPHQKEDLDHPSMPPEKQGMTKKPTDVEEIAPPNGVHLCNRSPKETEAFRRIIENYDI